MATEIKGLWAYSTHPFGDPTLSDANNGSAVWVRPTIPALAQKGSTGWLAKLNGGVQTNDDYARVSIPVNEMHLPDFATAKWSYYMTAAQSMGVNIVIWVHDPTDFDKRAEITQLGGHADLEKAAGWNAFEFSSATGGMFFYGETTTGTGLDAGTQYTWSQFISDALFKTWDIYRITLEYGWEVSGTFSDVWVADLQLNGKMIPLKPSPEEQLDIMRDDQAKALRTVPAWTFGKPTVVSANAGRAAWVLGQQFDSTYQKGNGWLAYLYGGLQSGDDYASVNIAVNEMPTPNFNTALWSYFMSATENFGVNIVIWLHDPTDFDKRCEVTQRQQHADLEKTAGWNAHELDTSVTQFFYWGEGVSGTDNIAAAGTDYTWAQYQTDALFSGWTIYRISFDYGWHGAAPTFDPAYLAEVSLNGTIIQLGPASGKHRKTEVVQKLMTTATHTADEVIAESVGTDWDFNMGGTGYITKALITHDAAISSRVSLFLYANPPTCAVDDEAANTGPLTADVAFYLGRIDFPAFSYQGSGDASALCTPSTVGNLPLAFDTPIIYGVLVTLDETITVAENLTIALTADMEDN